MAPGLKDWFNGDCATLLASRNQGHPNGIRHHVPAARHQRAVYGDQIGLEVTSGFHCELLLARYVRPLPDCTMNDD
ncbi:hypothetical protein CEP88_09960 [Roseobacter denitrificans]|uniref:Uncharacterized protein n=1 Tax=Roseobacter denitrificans (strain ATCC 33942 / OCh 114) TaxID=375451 RepID=Q160J8_ROSDO|nr:hypothetical protein RD1_4155 [Roseobacter denitrificans OCh 114]AVL52896.1 hypothetical protein CEP88_09960 [Roseobacter denitrificans]